MVCRSDSQALPERPPPLSPSKNEGPCLQQAPSNRQLGRKRIGATRREFELNWARLAVSVL